MEIYEKLAKIQQELKAPKNLFNKFGNYYYRNAEGILEAVKPILGDLVLLINDEPIIVGDRYYIKATVTLTDGKDSVSAMAYAREDEFKKGMDGCQITGACSSYARKYALNALFMIDDNKDSDDDSLSPKNPDNQKDDRDGRNTDGKEVDGVKKTDKLPSAANTMKDWIIDIQKRLKLGTYEEARKYVFMVGDTLMKSGAIDKFVWATITDEQAKNLFTAIKKNLPGDAA